MDERTNVIVLLCDQLQRHALRLYGGPVNTPNFERLAARGVVFDRFYCATPLCIPTRPSMMNGRWPHAHGAISFGKGHQTIERGSELLIDRLHDAGYLVAYDGIWHIDRPPEDDRRAEYAHFQEGRFPYAEHGEALRAMGLSPDVHRAPVPAYTDEGERPAQISVPVPATWTRPADEHPDMQRAQRIARFIREAPQERPVAAWCSLAGPHPPLLVPEPWMSMFDPEQIEPPPGFDMDRSELPWGVRTAPGALGTEGWEWGQWARAIAAYYGYVAFVDHCHGVVLDALAESGRLDNSIIVASTDHGEMLGALGIYQKMVLYERAINIPFIIAAPSIEPGRRTQLCSQTDLAPTVLQLLGMPPMARAQGRSMAPILYDLRADWRRYTFAEYNGWVAPGQHMRAVIGERYKYVYHHEAEPDQLFDLERDPDELTNLIAEPRYLELVDELRSELVGWMMDTDDIIQPSWPDLDLEPPHGEG